MDRNKGKKPESWHHVYGVTDDELRNAAREAQQRYGDILELPHADPKHHPRMARTARAPQFSPFAALTGYEAAVEETARLTEERLQLDEGRKAELDAVLQEILRHAEGMDALGREGLREHAAGEAPERPQVRVTWFVPDMKKSGGAYQTVTGSIRKADMYQRQLLLRDGTRIPLDEIYEIEEI